MTQNIIVPDIGDFDSVEIIEVLVKIGDQINKDDPIVTLESDKSSVEVPSPFYGKVSELKIKVGDKVSKGSLLAKLENDSSNNNLIASQKKEFPIADLNQTINTEIKKKIYSQPASKDDIDPLETKDWIESLNAVIENDGPSRASFILIKLYLRLILLVLFCLTLELPLI